MKPHALVAAATAACLSIVSPAAAETGGLTGDLGMNSIVLSPETRAFLDSLEGAPAVNTLPPAEARQVLIDVQTSADVEMPPASVEEMTLPVGPDGETTVYLVRPEEAGDETLPGVVYFHGGGWILGNFATHERLIRDLAAKSGAAFVFVEYAPAPEKKHPYQLEQDYAVLEYVAANPGEFRINAERLATAGDSVGGHMVAVIAMMAEQRGGPQIDAQVMLYPVTTAHLTTESYDRFADGPWLTKAMMEWFWNAYLPEDADRDDPMISPLLAGDAALANFAPTLVITDENDVLRDEGELFADRLVQVEVDVTATRYPHTMHDFMMLNPFTGAPEPRGAVNQTANWLKSHLFPSGGEG